MCSGRADRLWNLPRVAKPLGASTPTPTTLRRRSRDQPGKTHSYGAVLRARCAGHIGLDAHHGIRQEPGARRKQAVKSWAACLRGVSLPVLWKAVHHKSGLGHRRDGSPQATVIPRSDAGVCCCSSGVRPADKSDTGERSGRDSGFHGSSAPTLLRITGRACRAAP